jgi:hypothetical protein
MRVGAGDEIGGEILRGTGDTVVGGGEMIRGAGATVSGGGEMERGLGATVCGGGATVRGVIVVGTFGATVVGAGAGVDGVVIGREKSRREGAGSGTGVVVTGGASAIERRGFTFTFCGSRPRLIERETGGGATVVGGVICDAVFAVLPMPGVDVLGAGPPLVGDGMVVDGAGSPVICPRPVRAPGFTIWGEVARTGAGWLIGSDGRVETCGRPSPRSEEPRSKRRESMTLGWPAGAAMPLAVDDRLATSARERGLHVGVAPGTVAPRRSPLAKRGALVAGGGEGGR